MLKFLIFFFRLNATPSVMCPDFKQTNTPLFQLTRTEAVLLLPLLPTFALQMSKFLDQSNDLDPANTGGWEKHF